MLDLFKKKLKNHLSLSLISSFSRTGMFLNRPDVKSMRACLDFSRNEVSHQEITKSTCCVLKRTCMPEFHSIPASLLIF